MTASRLSTSALRSAARTLLPVVLACQASMAAAAYDMTYLKSLLAATPIGGWVQANTGSYIDATAGNPAFSLPDESYTNPTAIVRAWSSVAWDSKRGQLYSWGGGHANYIGNEMHVWSGTTGTWSLGSLPSRIENIATAEDPRTWLVVDDRAPQSAHTNDGNQYLPVNDMFLTFGDAVYNTGNGFQTRNAQGDLVRAGPWLWDPRKADPTKVGGTTGSGYDPLTPGGEMWLNRADQYSSAQGPGTSTFLMATSAYRTENGKDVVYVTKQGTLSSGFHDLYRYTVGDVRNGGLDTWEIVGLAWNTASGQTSAVLDDANNLYVHTTLALGFELQVWDLDKAGANNRDVAVNLVKEDGSELRLLSGAGIAYNAADGSLLLWDGSERGVVWRTRATYNSDGSLATDWVATRVDSVTSAQPNGNFSAGVFGKWNYVSELGAFVAVDEVSSANDAGVWFYKVSEVAAVPEAGTLWTMLAGLGGLGLLAARRRQRA